MFNCIKELAEFFKCKRQLYTIRLIIIGVDFRGSPGTYVPTIIEKRPSIHMLLTPFSLNIFPQNIFDKTTRVLMISQGLFDV